MARIFRQLYTVPDPDDPAKRVTRQSRKWYIEYVDGSGRRVRVPGFADRKATEHHAAQLEREAERVRCGMLVASELQHAARPLTDHLADYLKAVAARPSSPKHVEVTRARVKAVIDGLGWGRAAEATAGALQTWLGERRRPKPAGVGMSIQTANHYVRALKGFYRWLQDQGRIGHNPLAVLKCSNAEPDRRRERRALAADQFAALLATTRASLRPLYGLTGPQRAALYATAAYTGLRSSELASLTPESLQLDDDPPGLTVQARYSKRRRLDRLPLHPDLAALLREHVKAVEPGVPLFPGYWSPYFGAAMMREDLVAAEIPFEAAGRRFDFHSLRVQFITELARSDVPLVTAQKLARHSTPNLTANTYSALESKDLAGGVRKLPKMTTEPKKGAAPDGKSPG